MFTSHFIVPIKPDISVRTFLFVALCRRISFPDPNFGAFVPADDGQVDAHGHIRAGNAHGFHHVQFGDGLANLGVFHALECREDVLLSDFCSVAMLPCSITVPCRRADTLWHDKSHEQLFPCASGNRAVASYPMAPVPAISAQRRESTQRNPSASTTATSRAAPSSNPRRRSAPNSNALVPCCIRSTHTMDSFSTGNSLSDSESTASCASAYVYELRLQRNTGNEPGLWSPHGVQVRLLVHRCGNG